jgi:purine nucleosidase
MRLILDTDIGSDVDDALALAFAVRHPDIDLVGVTTVADDVLWRARIATKLLRIAGYEEVPVAPGVGWTTSPGGVRSRWTHDSEGFADDETTTYDLDGVEFLIEETERAPAEVATIGMQSNVAAAIERDPDVVRRIVRLDVMGGMFAPLADAPPTRDHNLMVDPDASVLSLNADVPKLIVPIDVSFHARLSTTHLERLREGDDLCRALAVLLDVWIRTSDPAPGVAAILHDPLLVACTVDKRFVTTETMKVTVVRHDGAVRTFIDPVCGREAEVVTSVDGPAFADFWFETVFR